MISPVSGLTEDCVLGLGHSSRGESKVVILVLTMPFWNEDAELFLRMKLGAEDVEINKLDMAQAFEVLVCGLEILDTAGGSVK